MNLQERVLSRRVMNLKDLALVASKLIKEGKSRDALEAIGDLGREASGLYSAVAAALNKSVQPNATAASNVAFGTDEAASNG